MKKYLFLLCLILFSGITFSQTTFRDYSELKSYVQRRPTFKSTESGVEITLNYTQSSGYFIELNSGKKLDIVDVSLNPSQPQIAIFGIEWIYEPAPLILDLRSGKNILFLPPIQGEENVSFDSQGRLRPGRTGRTNWMRLSMGGSGIQFTPYDVKPDPEYFRFVNFKGKAPDDNTVYKTVDTPAEFPGGKDALMKWLRNNIRYPEAAAQNDIQGCVIIKFVVERDGSISNVSVAKSVDKTLDNEAMRLVRKMPKWLPGKKNGMAVRSYAEIPITFKLSGDNKINGHKLSEDNKINGHKYVDLGLPSGLKWATCNVGAKSPDDYGDYFCWGATTTGGKHIGDSYGDLSINLQYDAANANWGGSWRMPSAMEFEELINSCTWTWVTVGQHQGYKVTGPNGKSIFLPAAGFYKKNSRENAGSNGYYWSSDLYPFDTIYLASGSLHFNNRTRGMDEDNQAHKLCVRPVTK